MEFFIAQMLTIVIASYRYGHLAAHCVETILNQNPVPNIMFVDDGVGDCAHIRDVYPEVQFFQNERTLGVVNNFQNMLNRVNTTYCMFVGADNWLRSDAVSLFYEKIERENSDIITYDLIITGTLKIKRVKCYTEELQTINQDYYLPREFKHHGSMVYRTDLAKSVGGYIEYRDSEKSPNSLEDLNLWDRMIASGARVSHIPEGLLYYRHHKENYNKYDK